MNLTEMFGKESAQNAAGLDPVCAYTHGGPCPTWPRTAAAPGPGKFTYEVRPNAMGTQTLHGYMDGQHVGYLEHEVHGNGSDPTGVHVTTLHTSNGHRGQGIGSTMMNALYSHYPKAWVNHGDRTDEGAGWWSKYKDPAPHRNVHNVHPNTQNHGMAVPWTQHWDSNDVASQMQVNQATHDRLGLGGSQGGWATPQQPQQRQVPPSAPRQAPPQPQRMQPAQQQPTQPDTRQRGTIPLNQPQRAQPVQTQQPQGDSRQRGTIPLSQPQVPQQQGDGRQRGTIQLRPRQADGTSQYTPPPNGFPDRNSYSNDQGVHRGLSVVLPKDVHDFVHNESNPAPERAEKVLSEVRKQTAKNQGPEGEEGSTGGLGNYWTPSPHKAAEYCTQSGWQTYRSHENVHNCGDEYSGDLGCPTTHVVLHADTPAPEHHWTERFREGEKYDPAISWRLPVRPGAPISLNGVSWRQGNDSGAFASKISSEGTKYHQTTPFTRYDFPNSVQKEARA